VTRISMGDTFDWGALVNAFKKLGSATPHSPQNFSPALVLRVARQHRAFSAAPHSAPNLRPIPILCRTL
jgi:hypothetical protein